MRKPAGCDIGDGNGWINVGEADNSSYDTPISQCLVDKGYLDAKIHDRISTTVIGSDSGFAYIRSAREIKRRGSAHTLKLKKGIVMR